MSLMYMIFGQGGKAAYVPTQYTVSFTTSGTWVCPAGVSIVDAAGKGARGVNGQPASSYYYETKQIFATRRSDGVRVLVSSDRVFKNGTPPHNGYCNPVVNSPTDPTYSSNQTCYAIDGVGTFPATSPTTGASSTGLGKSFPGSLGNNTVATTSFEDIPVTAGSSYTMTIATGGSITITYEL